MRRFRVSVSVSPVLTAGLGLALIGDDLVGELGAQTLALKAFDDGRWLLQWDALVAFRGGVLANTYPYTSFLGGTARGNLELGTRFTPAARWSPYLGGRLAANLQVMGHPGVALADLDTLNNSDGFGGLTLDGALRVAGGVSLLDPTTSLLLTAFVQEALVAPGLVTAGLALTEFGLAGRFDLWKRFTLFLEALVGVSPALANDALQSVNQRLRLQVSGGLRKTFENGVWFGVAASYTRDSDHTVYTQASRAYDSVHPGTTSVTLSFGVALWRLP